MAGLPFRALLAFEATARLGSVTAAAAELYVTQSAVSRQIRALEEHLHLALFLRSHRQVTPTDAGRILLDRISDHFRGLDTALRAVSNAPAHRRLTVVTPTTFALRWLIPRLGDFRSLHPGIDLQLRTSPETIDVLGGTVDVAVRYGLPGGPGHHSRSLLTNQIALACHLTAEPALRRALSEGDLSLLPLIQTATRPRDWRRWADCYCVSLPDPRNMLTFENSFLAHEAVRAGLGVALIHRIMLPRAGEEVSTLSDYIMPVEETFHLVTAKDRAALPPLKSFEDWLVGTMLDVSDPGPQRCMLNLD